jgi:hypothetical protein
MSASPTPVPHDVHGKALALNLDPSTYGTLAEIGAGQEVARWFLKVGAASGTVAKTISAYDKIVSDDIYGGGTRYVSKDRLLAMLDHEYKLVVERLSATRGRESRFFAFADTVATRNYQGTNEQHGWLGIRFQPEPLADSNQILLHINLRDSTASQQQQAIGILGVNLIYAAFHQKSDVETFLAGLFHQLAIERIEVDVIELEGPAFASQDSRQWCLGLLRRDMANAIVFDSHGHISEPSSILRKRPLVVMRGSFSHPELFDPRLLQAATRQLLAEGAAFEREPATVLEMTIRHVSGTEAFSGSEMADRVEQITHGGPVVVSSYPETYLLSRYLRRYTTEPVRFILGVSTAAKTMHEAFYKDLPGTLLEGLGRLFATNVKVYVAPMPRDAFFAAVGDMAGGLEVRDSGDSFVTLDDLTPSLPGRHLLDYLRGSGRVVAMEKA